MKYDALVHKFTNRFPAHQKEDAFQELQIAVWKAETSFDDTRGVKELTLVYTAVRNRYLVLLNQSINNPAPQSLTTKDNTEIEIADRVRHDILERISADQIIDEIKRMCTAQERKVLDLYLDGAINHTDIAVQMGITPQRVSQIFAHVCRKALTNATLIEEYKDTISHVEVDTMATKKTGTTKTAVKKTAPVKKATSSKTAKPAAKKTVVGKAPAKKAPVKKSTKKAAPAEKAFTRKKGGMKDKIDWVDRMYAQKGKTKAQAIKGLLSKYEDMAEGYAKAIVYRLCREHGVEFESDQGKAKPKKKAPAKKAAPASKKKKRRPEPEEEEEEEDDDYEEELDEEEEEFEDDDDDDEEDEDEEEEDDDFDDF